MKYNEFLKSVKRFSEETAKWSELPGGTFYTTEEPYGWKETCDNEHGGLDVSWAFKMSEKDIEKNAPQEYVDQLLNELENLTLDNDFEKDEILEIINNKYNR